MSAKRPLPEDLAQRRAEAQAKFAKFNAAQKSPKTQVPSAATEVSQKKHGTGTSTAPGSTRPGIETLNPEIARRIEAARIRAEAQNLLAQKKAEELAKHERAVPAYDARGGLGIGLHPALAAEAVSARKSSSQRSKFATTTANFKPAEPKAVPKHKQLELLSGPDAAFTDREQNPYFDPKLGGRDTSRPVDRRSKPLVFSEHGKYIHQGDKLRQEANLKALQERLAQTARRAGLEEDLDVSGRAIAREDPPEIEWWDAPYTVNGTYDDIESDALKIESYDSPITVMVEHPIPMPAPTDAANSQPASVMFTPKEYKKMRNQNRAALRKDKQDKQRLGLLPPDEPKVKLSNIATVLANSSIQDPTKVENKVRAQVQARKDLHEQTNEERKLTPEQKQAKAAQKLAEDEARGIHAAAWRIETFANGYLRKRVDENAQQCGLTGIVVLNPRFNLIYAEGGAKSIKFFRKLLENRIDWTEVPRNPPPLADNEQEPDYEENKCTPVWEGELKKRTLPLFKFKKCQFEVDVKEALKTDVYHLWTIAKNGKEE